MPLPSLLRIITSLSCTVTLFAGLILDPESMMVHANGPPPELIESPEVTAKPEVTAPPNKVIPIEVANNVPLDGVTYSGDGTISVYPEMAYPGSPTFMKYLVDEKLYNNDKVPWSKRYSPLHPHVVRHACNIIFNGSSGVSPSRIIYGNLSLPKYKNLVVFMPDDVYMAEVELKLELVQGVIFSIISSGAFDKNAQVTIVTSVPELDEKGVPLNAMPVRSFNIRNVCNSLADDHNDENIIRFIMSEAVKKRTNATPGNELVKKNKILPLTLMQAWYQMAAFFSPNSENGTPPNSEYDTPPNLFSVVQDYYSKFEGEPQGSAEEEHIDYETKSLYDISEDSVLLILGSNDAYAELLHKGAISSENLLGIEYCDRKLLDPQVGVRDVSFLSSSTEYSYVKDPVFCPGVYVSDSNSQSAGNILHETGNLSPIFKDFVKQSDAGANYLSTNNPAIVKNCDKYSHLNDLDKGKQHCTLYMNSFRDFGATKCKGSTAANEQLASLISMMPPRKVIQVQLAPDVNNHIYEKISNTDLLAIQQTIMGCPDLLPEIDKKEYISSSIFNKSDENPDKGMLSVCAPPEYGIDSSKTLNLRNKSFAQAYNNALNMTNDVTYAGYYEEGCVNSILTLYASADERSIFHYPKISNYFNTIINMHLNGPCIGRDNVKFAPGSVPLWRHDCVYHPELETFKCDNMGFKIGFSGEYMRMLLSIQDGLYTWHNPVDCRNFKRAYNKNIYLPQMKCMFSNKILLRKVNSIYPNRFVTSVRDSEVVYD